MFLRAVGVLARRFFVRYPMPFPSAQEFDKTPLWGQNREKSQEGKSMLKEFKEFAMKGNVMDMAVGIIIGAAFGAIVGSLVADVLMPPIGLLLGHVDFSNLFILLRAGTTPGPYETLDAARKAGAVTLNYGHFINTIINFLIVALAVFFMVRSINNLRRKQAAPAPAPTAPAAKECPFCASAIPIKAVKCPHCTADLK